MRMDAISPRVLIVRLSSLGDILRFLPLAGSIKQHNPRAHVTWVTTAAYRDLLVMCPYVDPLLALDIEPHDALRTALPRLFTFLPLLRRTQFDVAIDAHSTPLSNARVLLSRATRRIGIDHPNHYGLRMFRHVKV